MNNKSEGVDSALWFFHEMVRLVTGLMTTVSHIVAPLPPAIVMGFLYYFYVLLLGYPEWAARIAGAGAAFALEVLGLLSFETLARFYKYGGYPTYASIVGVLAYFAIGLASAHLEGGNPELVYVMYAITGTVYLVRSAYTVANDKLEEIKEQEKREREEAEFEAKLKREDKQDAKDFRREQRRKQNDQQLRIEMMEKEAEIAKEMAKIEAQKQVAMSRNQPQLVAMQSAPPVTTPTIEYITWDYRTWRNVTREHKMEMLDMSKDEISQRNPNLDPKTVRNWHESYLPKFRESLNE